MEALRYHGDKGLKLEDLPAPTPGPGEILIEVQTVGICRTDIEKIGRAHV